MMTNRPAYPSDLTDGQWEILQPLIPPAKHVAEAHGGRIEVESEPNVRTCFRLILPLDTKPETG